MRRPMTQEGVIWGKREDWSVFSRNRGKGSRQKHSRQAGRHVPNLQD